jgi:hypothetical protein
MDINKHQTVLNLLKFSNIMEKQGELLWAAWMRQIANAIVLEKMYPEQTKIKPIFENMDGFENIPEKGIVTVGNIIRWCQRVYNPYHVLRNNVELFDSIEEVRVLLKHEFKVVLDGRNEWKVEMF